MKTYFIYNASAGSGKTFTIVLEYLKLVLRDPSKKTFVKILALTFTNKAAYEMKFRILTALLELSNNNSSKYYDELLKYFNYSYQNIKNNAKKVLSNILHDYSNFSISTIDKFNLYIIHSFFKEFEISNNFFVKINSDFYIEETIEEFINTIGTNNIYSKSLVNFVLNQYEEENTVNKYSIQYIYNDLIKQFKEYTNEKNYFFIQSFLVKSSQDFIKLKKTIENRIKHLQEKMINIVFNSLSFIYNNQLSYQDFNGGKRNSIMIFFEKAKKNLEINNYDKIISQLYEILEKKIIQNTLISKKSKNQSILKYILPQLIENFQYYCLLLENYIIDIKILKEIIHLEINYELKKILNIIKKKKRNCFSF